MRYAIVSTSSTPLWRIREALPQGCAIVATIDELADQYRDALEVSRRAFARMSQCAVGSAEGTRYARLSNAATQRASELRRAMLNHSDAPPQG
jgi:hypothetical protein